MKPRRSSAACTITFHERKHSWEGSRAEYQKCVDYMGIFVLTWGATVFRCSIDPSRKKKDTKKDKTEKKGNSFYEPVSTPLTTGLVAWSASEEDLDSGDTGQSASKRSFRHDLGCLRGVFDSRDILFSADDILRGIQHLTA